MNYSLNVKSSSIVHTLLSNCVKLLGKVQKLLIQFINYSVISKRIRVVSPKFYTVRKNFTGSPVPPVPTNLKSGQMFQWNCTCIHVPTIFIKTSQSNNWSNFIQEFLRKFQQSGLSCRYRKSFQEQNLPWTYFYS